MLLAKTFTVKFARWRKRNSGGKCSSRVVFNEVILGFPRALCYGKVSATASGKKPEYCKYLTAFVCNNEDGEEVTYGTQDVADKKMASS